MSVRIVLAGAGHAHLHVAAHAAELIRAGARVTLVTPGPFWYSGRATAMLGAQFEPRDDQIDPGALIEASGGQFVEGLVTNLDRRNRKLILADGRQLDYDLLSINVGSVVDDRKLAFAADGQDIWPVKPISGLAGLRAQLRERFRRGEIPRLAIIGGGATGCEAAANLAALARHHEAEIDLRLIHDRSRLAPSLPERAVSRLTRHLRAMGIDIRLERRVAQLEARILYLDDGQRMDVDTLVVATGLRAPAWLDAWDLPFDDGLVVDDTLRSVADPRVFAVGDCARLQGHVLPRLGVFGVRQAPVLHANLLACIHDKPMQRYRPQSRWLSILELGDGTGLATRGKLWWHGRISRWLKHRLDQRFLARYQY